MGVTLRWALGSALGAESAESRREPPPPSPPAHSPSDFSACMQALNIVVPWMHALDHNLECQWENSAMFRVSAHGWTLF